VVDSGVSQGICLYDTAENGFVGNVLALVQTCHPAKFLKIRLS